MGTKKEPSPLESIEMDGIGTVVRGLKVKHATFGRGVVEDIFAWDSGETLIRVMFKKAGSKALVPEYAKLKKALW